jgi:hypothetical protein
VSLVVVCTLTAAAPEPDEEELYGAVKMRAAGKAAKPSPAAATAGTYHLLTIVHVFNPSSQLFNVNAVSHSPSSTPQVLYIQLVSLHRGCRRAPCRRGGAPPASRIRLGAGIQQRRRRRPQRRAGNLPHSRGGGAVQIEFNLPVDSSLITPCFNPSLRL